MTKFQTVDLRDAYNADGKASELWEDSTARAIQTLPAGHQTFWGIPFDLGENEESGPALVSAGADGSTGKVTIGLNAMAIYLVFAHVCDSRASTTIAGQTADYPSPVVTAPGERLANYVLVYEDGRTEVTAVRRRFEVKARSGGVTVIEDFAHHPTEVAVTVEAAREETSGRLWVVFQPHRYTRTADLAPEFGKPLAEADRVIVTDVFAAGERPQPGVTGRLVAEAVAASGGTVEYIPHLADVPAALVPELEPGDTVVLMGAGDVAQIWPNLVEGRGSRS